MSEEITNNETEDSLDDIFNDNYLSDSGNSSDSSDNEGLNADNNNDDSDNSNTTYKKNNNKLEDEKEVGSRDYFALEERFRDTKKWANDLSRKVKTLDDNINGYITEGILSQDEGAKLKESIKTDHDLVKEPVIEHGMFKHADTWDSEIINLRKYTNDPELDVKLQAFTHMFKNMCDKEIDELTSIFDKYSDDSIGSTRKMISMGADYANDIYNDLKKHGNVKGMNSFYKKEIKKLQKTIDKLSQNNVSLDNDNDYIRSNSYSLPSGGSSKQDKSEDDSFESLFN